MKRNRFNTKKRKGLNAPKASSYSKKHKFLLKHGGWGFDYPDKPWK